MWPNNSKIEMKANFWSLMNFDLFDLFRKFQHIHFHRAANRNCISPSVLAYVKYNFNKQHTLYITVQRRCTRNVGHCWNITVGKLLLQWSMSHNRTKEVKEYDVYLQSAMLLITLCLCVYVFWNMQNSPVIWNSRYYWAYISYSRRKTIFKNESPCVENNGF